MKIENIHYRYISLLYYKVGYFVFTRKKGKNEEEKKTQHKGKHRKKVYML